MSKLLSLVFMEASRGQINGSSEWWALGWDMQWTHPQYVDRWFEIHHERVWESGMSPPLDKRAAYTKWLNRLPGEKVLWEPHADIRASTGYPMDKVAAIPGVGTYLASSMAYMLCQAVLEGHRDIEIMGCDFSHAEWQETLFERPNLAYLIGLFRAQGVEIKIPQLSTLWQLYLLDDFRAEWDIPHSRVGIKKFHAMYKYGLWVGSGKERDTEFENEMMALPWEMVPYYGHETLDEVGATPQRYAEELRREIMGLAE